MPKEMVIQTADDVSRYRSNFTKYLAINENYFGNLDVETKPVTEIVEDTTFEEIGCVGYNPVNNQMYASVIVKQPYGYLSDTCGTGSQQYVRFYIDYGEGGGWTDLGATAFRAYNIPEGTKDRRDLDYAVQLPVDVFIVSCKDPGFARVRAILSWNMMPPPNTPDFRPVWGEVQNVTIQRPRKGGLDDETPMIKLPELKPIFETYQEMGFDNMLEGQKQEATHFLMPYVAAAMEKHSKEESLYQISNESMELLPGLLEEFGLSFEALLEEPLVIADGEALEQGSGSTFYEELDCIALDREAEQAVAFFRIKRPYGYSGDLCSSGSLEFVTFWADTNRNGNFEGSECLGKIAIPVYDLEKIPDEISYAVALPVNFERFRRPACREGQPQPVVFNLRGILSWATAHPCSAPNRAPTWGNRQDSLVQIRPDKPIETNEHIPVIQQLGSVSVIDIASSGYASFGTSGRPFGGRVDVHGIIRSAVDVSAGAAPLLYRLMVRPEGSGVSGWRPVFDQFKITITTVWPNGVLTPTHRTMVPDVDGFVEYFGDMTGSVTKHIAAQLGTGNLGSWHTGDKEGHWQIKVQVKDPGSGRLEDSDIHDIYLDNVRPTAELTITSPVPCGDSTVGVPIEGRYTAMDDVPAHFHQAFLQITDPTDPSVVFATIANSRFTTGSNPLAQGTNRPFSFSTTGMQPCGYTLRLIVWDKTIVNSNTGYVHRAAAQSFCLRD